MSVIVVSGSAGLVGAESVRFFAAEGFDVVGIDNDMRRVFFGQEASTCWNRQRLEIEVRHYRHIDGDIRDTALIELVFASYGNAIAAVVHAAAQPSHDWAARDPQTDFTVNANGTLNLLEATRRHCPEASFVFTSTNKVYGDAPNKLPLIEQDLRWELSPEHPFAAHGIDESMSVDACLHSLFGASKLAADIVVQEYGRYFGMRTACFRGGCLTGPGHSGTMLHGFLAYLAKCATTDAPYTVLGYKGKQVRDNIHSYDLSTRSGTSSRHRDPAPFTILAGPPRQLLGDRGDRHLRAADRATDELVLFRAEPRWRPYLVDLGCAPVSERLPANGDTAMILRRSSQRSSTGSLCRQKLVGG